jgi:hypothetical protein
METTNEQEDARALWPQVEPVRPRRTEPFCWRVQQLVGEGGFALVTGAPSMGKSVTLRILTERLGNQREVKVGIVSRPQARLGDFYRELGDLFGVELSPHNRWAVPRSCANAGRPLSMPACHAPCSSSTKPRRRRRPCSPSCVCWRPPG